MFIINNKDMKDLITHSILKNSIHPTDFEINQEELNLLEDIQDELFDKLNDFNLTVIPSNSDTILTHYIIAHRINPQITVNEFLGLYLTILPTLTY